MLYDLDAGRDAVTPAARCASTILMALTRATALPCVKPVTLGENGAAAPCPRLGAARASITSLSRTKHSYRPGFRAGHGGGRQHGGSRHQATGRAHRRNAGGALAAYGARAGMEVFVFMPDDTPRVNQIEAYLAGAHVFLVNGLINDCGRIVREGTPAMGWFDMSTLKEPYRIEGKKTMGLELAEQFGWTLPDVILYPTGGGTGLIGMWKAFAELTELGWLKSTNLPRLVSCQSAGCAPIVRAFDEGAERFAETFPNALPRPAVCGCRSRSETS